MLLKEWTTGNVKNGCAMALGLCLLAGSAQAQKSEELFVGVGALYRSTPYLDRDDEVYPIPMIRYEGKRVYWRMTEGGYKALASPELDVALAVRGRLESYEEDDSPVFSGMEEREPTVEVGVRTQWRPTPRGEASLTLFGDVVDRHGGFEGAVEYAHRFGGPKTGVIPFAGLEWMSEELVDYYYGVRAEEARPGRPAYEADSAVNVYGGFRVRHVLSERWSVVGEYRYTELGESVTDSPLVEEEGIHRMMVGAMYRFGL